MNVSGETPAVSLIKHHLLHPTNYFATAEYFTTLQKKFTCKTLFERIVLWMDMAIYPIFLLWWSPFAVMTAFAVYKAIRMWIDWYMLRYTAGIVLQWVQIVRSYGGPFISTNDSNYHVFVYADGMQRLLLSEKGAKGL